MGSCSFFWPAPSGNLRAFCPVPSAPRILRPWTTAAPQSQNKFLFLSNAPFHSAARRHITPKNSNATPPNRSTMIAPSEGSTFLYRQPLERYQTLRGANKFHKPRLDKTIANSGEDEFLPLVPRACSKALSNPQTRERPSRYPLLLNSSPSYFREAVAPPFKRVKTAPLG